MDANFGTHISASEAKARFAELLNYVLAGNEIIITRHGQPVARCAPIAPALSIERRQDSIKEMRELASRNRLNGLRAHDLKGEGRK
jgi:prevent-host-death family protein